MPRGTVGILLAAGSSQRFGGDKLMHRLPNATPMAVAAAIHLRAACPRTIAVLRPRHETLARLLAAVGCEVVVCADARGGMGYSLASGVRAARDASGWVVALADMPFIAAASYRAVMSRLHQGAKLAACAYQQQRGHPVGYSCVWFDALTALTGEQGGKIILETHPQDLVLCPVNDPGVIRDIDTPEDLNDIDGADWKSALHTSQNVL